VAGYGGIGGVTRDSSIEPKLRQRLAALRDFIDPSGRLRVVGRRLRAYRIRQGDYRAVFTVDKARSSQSEDRP
jgi:mRNA-degrading endonuclease RelE of RelBE toxin-antitoxin system